MKAVVPERFEWVYVYLGKQTDAVGYVGRAKNSSRCARRLFEHRSDSWYTSEKWKLFVCPCANRCESEYIETTYINRYKPKYNKGKVGWGTMLDDNIIELERLPSFDEDMVTCKEQAEWALNDYETQIKTAMVNSGEWEMQPAYREQDT